LKEYAVLFENQNRKKQQENKFLYLSQKAICNSLKLNKLSFVKKKSGFVVSGLGVSSDDQVLKKREEK